VNLEILQRPASLAAPTVALQHSLPKCCVRFRIESQPRPSLSNPNRRILLFAFKNLKSPRLHNSQIRNRRRFAKAFDEPARTTQSSPAARKRDAVKHFSVLNRFVQPVCTFGELMRPRTPSLAPGLRKSAFLPGQCPVFVTRKSNPSVSCAPWVPRWRSFLPATSLTIGVKILIQPYRSSLCIRLCYRRLLRWSRLLLPISSRITNISGVASNPRLFVFV
jgi:hypothetical protein